MFTLVLWFSTDPIIWFRLEGKRKMTTLVLQCKLHTVKLPDRQSPVSLIPMLSPQRMGMRLTENPLSIYLVLQSLTPLVLHSVLLAFG